MATSGSFLQNNGSEKAPKTKVYELEKETEVRCEVAWDSPVSVKLLRGTAEIFGTEIAQGQTVVFNYGAKFAVFTWHGASLEVEGVPEAIYVADETPMVSYVNVHAILENRRQVALTAAKSGGPVTKQGPRILLVGPVDSGKSSLAKLLLTYCARAGWKPLFVDLDIGQGELGVPGAIGATPVEAPIDPAQGFPQDSLMLFFYGHTTPSVNPQLYRSTVEQLGAVMERQVAESPMALSSGVVVNSMGWIEGLGYDLLLHSIQALKVDTVLVLGQERLYSMLQGLYAGNGVDVVKLARSGGVVARDKVYRSKTRDSRTRAYFYGIGGQLAPHAAMASFADLQVYRVGGGGPQAPQSALPVGAKRAADPLRVTLVTISQELVHAVLAVSYAKAAEDVLTSNVAGFVYVTSVDMARKRISYVAPSPGPLPNNVLLAGTLQFVE